VSKSPYKFLDSYGSEDRELFFGRERETEILLADVTLSRLVVLFSRTGTGKTSLINAAVRPELEDRGFETFLVRLREGDPVKSALDVLAPDPGDGGDRDGSFAARLDAVVERLERPIVVFFDQFEEFFLYQLRDAPERAYVFISEVARLYRDRGSGVHLVFSMREDFYVELDVFRDEIPTIFHNDSNLRLRWFEPDQARSAMVRPAAAWGVDLEPDLVERVIGDLARGAGRVEPAELQIVCDTLWREAGGNGAITLDLYLSLGSAGVGGTVAEQILNRRLAEQFKVFEDPADFELLARLLEPGVLSTERGTKYVRELDGLSREVGEIQQLRRVLTALEEARLVALLARDDLYYVELTHDYLVADPERLRELRANVRDIWPRRVLVRAHERMPAGDLDAADSDDVVAVLRRVADEREEAQRGGSTADHLALQAADAELMLRLGLRRGVLKRVSFDIARDRGLPVWELLRGTMREGRRPDAANAVDLLGQLGDDEAVQLLVEALSNERLARGAISALERAGTVAAVHALAGALADARLAGLAAGALTTLAAAFDTPEIAGAAADALLRHLEPQLDDARTAPAAIDALGALEVTEAVDLLERVRRSGRFRAETESALGWLKDSSHPPVAERAERALAAAPPPPRPEPPPSRPPDPAPPPPRSPVTAVDENTYWLIASRLLDGYVIPLLGPGAAVADRPAGSRWQLGEHLPYASELAEFLARRSRYPDPEAGDLLRVAEYVRAMLGERTLYESLREAFDADYPPNSLHRLLAAVPPILRERGVPYQLIVTTSFDDTLERAFAERDEPFDVVFYEAKGAQLGTFVHRRPDGTGQPIRVPNEYVELSLDDRTVILKLLGSVDREDPGRDSFAITEDDFIYYLSRTNLVQVIPITLRQKMADSHFLFLGYSLRNWTTRLILTSIFGQQSLDLKSWAVHSVDTRSRLAELERTQWSKRGDIELLGVGLDEFTARLAEQLAELPREDR
jgi:hypothetical protein